jgi:transcription-repair coupling factor (superfamily II helicase)
MQGIKVEEEQEVQIDLNITSFIPDEYIQSGSQKIDIYQDIALCRTEEDIEDVVDEITDRYGNMPKEVENLLKISRIKQEARKSNIIKVIQRGEKIIFTFNKNKFNMDNISKLVEKYKNRIKFSEGINPYITYKIENMENLVSETRIFIENCR